MNASILSLQLILLASGAACTIALLKLLITSNFRSLLAWQALFFVTITSTGTAFQAWEGQPEDFMLPVSADMFRNSLLAGIIANLIIFALVFWLRSVYTPAAQITKRPQEKHPETSLATFETSDKATSNKSAPSGATPEPLKVFDSGCGSFDYGIGCASTTKAEARAPSCLVEEEITSAQTEWDVARRSSLPKTSQAKDTKNVTSFSDPLSRLKTRMMLGLFLVIAAFVYNLRTEGMRFGLDNLREFFTGANYKYVYQLRIVQLDIETSNLQIYVFYIILNNLLSLLNLVSLYYTLKSKDPFWRVVYGITLSIWLYDALATLEKAPVIMPILSNIFLIMAVSLEGKSKQMARRLLITTMGISLVVVSIAAIYILAGYQGDILTESINRLIVVPAWSNLGHFATYPAFRDWVYYGGSRTFNLLLTGGMTPEDWSQWSVPQTVAVTVTGSRFDMNCSVLGDGWANFGFIGVIEEVSLLFGAFATWDYFFRRRWAKGNVLPLLCFFVGHFPPVLNNDLMFLSTKHGVIVEPLIFLWLVRGAMNEPSVQTLTSKLSAGSRILEVKGLCKN